MTPHRNERGKWRKAPLVERFERFFSKNIGCWEWLGSTRRGYGIIDIERENAKGRRSAYAHRVSWTLYRGEIPGGLWVLHKCDNRPCVNPDHLFLGTQQDNNADMFSKGRNVILFGTRNGSTKLTPENVVDMRMRYSRGESSHSIAKRYGVDGATARDAISGKTWKQVKACSPVAIRRAR